MTPALLEKWTNDPSTAPGRLTSSPWPDRIEVGSVAPGPGGDYAVRGEVVERTSADAAGASGRRIPVEIALARVDGRWRITKYEENRSGVGQENESVAAAVNVVHAYYRAIDERRYEDAYRLWGSKGASSGKTLDQFRSGFSETAKVEAELGSPGPIGAAAGSRYVEVPVRVRARLRSGVEQHFEGTYTLRRAVVDGATLEQRTWHIDSAKLRQVQ